ncbi:Brain tumor protein, partial [Stegodyphus mimosarum]
MASQDMALTSCDEEVANGCHLCKSKFEQPRVLSCLHVFCEECLKKHIAKNGFMPNMLECPDCLQETKLDTKGVSGLPLDYIACNRIDLKAMEKTQIVCTSCKAKETAVARCTECATFLCPNCVTAHQFMRCFESHTVLSFDEMKGDGDSFTTIHKPVTCNSHPDEVMKYYCHTCHVPICNECMILDHKQPEHCYEKAVDAEQKQREELRNLISESESKVQFCEEAASVLDTHLSDLQMQYDNARSYIEETFQSYKAILERQQEQLLKELDSIHSSQELQIMETFHNVEKTIEKIDDACKFAERLLSCGNTLEILSLIHIVGTQLLSLINNTPKLDISVGIAFETDEKKFEASIQEHFGKVKKPEPPAKKEDSPVSQKASPMHSSSSFESDAFSLSTGVITPDNTLPSLDVDLANNIVAQYNLAQLAGMAERSISQSSSNATPPPLNFADLLTTESDVTAAQLNAINNLTALAKMGSISLSNGQASLNGQLVSGLNLHSTQMPNSPPSGNQVMRVMNSPSPIEGLESLLGNSSIVGSGSRVGSPLNGPVLNGGSFLTHGVHSPPILPPSALSPMTGQTYNPAPRSSSVKLSTMQIRCKFGQLGPGKSQFSSPHGFCLGIEEEIIVADTNNHRIQVFEKTGDFKYQFGVAGKEEGQLWYPRKVAVIRSSGKFVVCDRGSERSRMQIFTKTGHFLKKIAIRYIDIVAGLAITSEGTIVAVDSVAPTVFIISEVGDLLHWFDCSEYMREPSDITVRAQEFYICDFKGHCVIVFSEKGHFLRRIGCENITNFPNGIDISDAGDVLVGDSHGNRFHIVVFSREGTLLSEFECPYVKVSRCCGLKITSEGYVVTLAKNNHHVLVLNTLYVV